MTKLPRGLVGFSAFLVVMIAATTIAMSAQSDPPAEVATVERAADSNFPEPMIESLVEPLDIEGTSLSLSPPGVALAAAPIDGKAAVEIAEGEFGPSAFPDQVTASLAWEDEGSRLVWAVSFVGICVLERGPAGHDGGCGAQELIVIVDATTGHVDGMVSYR